MGRPPTATPLPLMAQNFGDVWRRVRLHATGAPFGLVRGWVQDAYEDLCERRPWTWLQRETRLATLASRTLTVGFVQDSQVITSAVGGFLATDVGRQIRVGTYPYYTITVVQDAWNAVIDLPYADVGGSLTASILSAYQTLPADFGAFLLIADLSVQRQIAWWYTAEELARVDPLRSSAGDPQRAIIPTTLSPVPTTLGQPRAEWWPSPASAKVYPAWYRARPQPLADTDVFQGVLRDHTGALESGALARCARWPGTAEAKNPYFNVALGQQLRDDFDKACATLELRDDDQAQQSWVALPYHRWPAWGLGGDTTTLRASDATVADYL